VVGWLYEGADRRIPTMARELLATQPVRFSPVVELELTYLYEVGRVSEPASVPLAALGRSIGLTVADTSVVELVAAAVDLTWTRDPFDRLIAAQAIAAGVPLVTADRAILENLPQAVWD
jgi:PIN domain nuclease of toxin-antitoxin system